MRFYLVFFLLFSYMQSHAQYLMSNQTVNDCEGTLSDSEANTQQAGWYDHNENFIFTICPTGASSIIIDFSFFCKIILKIYSFISNILHIIS